MVPVEESGMVLTLEAKETVLDFFSNKTVYHSTSSEQTCMHTILMVQYGNGR